jgi:Ca2+:H+ antiporter
VCGLVQLYSHRHLYEGPPDQTVNSPLGHTQDLETNLIQTEHGHGNGNDVPMLGPVPNAAIRNGTTPTARMELAGSSEVKYVRTDIEEHRDDDDEEEEDLLGFWRSICWLAVVTILISFLSDALVATIEDAAKSWDVSSVFLSAIVIPIIGNAAEHAGAVIFARKNKCDLAISIAVGSSTQIALMVLPLLVIIGWFGGYDLTLNFQPYEAISLFLTVVMVTFVIVDGSSNYLVGAGLVAAYIIVSAGFFAHKDEDLSN